VREKGGHMCSATRKASYLDPTNKTNCPILIWQTKRGPRDNLGHFLGLGMREGGRLLGWKDGMHGDRRKIPAKSVVTKGGS